MTELSVCDECKAFHYEENEYVENHHLYASIMLGHTECFEITSELMLADMNDEIHGSFQLALATKKMLLLQHLVDNHVSTDSMDEDTYQIICNEGYMEIIQLLHAADLLNMDDVISNTAEADYLDLIKFAVAHGGQVKAEAIYNTIKYGSDEMLEYLISLRQEVLQELRGSMFGTDVTMEQLMILRSHGYEWDELFASTCFCCNEDDSIFIYAWKNGCPISDHFTYYVQSFEMEDLEKHPSWREFFLEEYSHLPNIKKYSEMLSAQRIVADKECDSLPTAVVDSIVKLYI